MISAPYKAMRRPIARRYFYDALNIAFTMIAVSFIYIVWNAETKRVIHNNNNVLRFNVFESSDPVQFAQYKDDAWQMMTLFSALSALAFIFRKEAHAFLTD